MNLVRKQQKIAILVQFFIFLFIIGLHFIIGTNMIKYVPECTIYKKFGFICPACGGTRFIINLLNLNFIQAFYMHPLFFLLTLYLIILNIVYIINIFFNKKIELFRWWHIVFWGILVVIFTIFRNINF